jgi:micrococcal nuclease
MRLLRRPGVAGSLVLALIIVVVLLRPAPGGDEHPDDVDGPGSVRAPVVRAIDGDTIEVALSDGREDVRYIGVDTPETVKPGEPVQCYGPRASDFNHRLVDGRRVRLVFDRERRDVYGRLLAYVYVRGRMVSAELVRRGLARTLTIPPNDRFAPLLARLERRAAVAGRGLWGACPP